MSSEDVDKVFNQRDFNIMEWAFCRFMCQDGGEYFTDYQLFLNSGINGVMGDQELMKSYVLEDVDNIYREFIRRVMRRLVNRGFLSQIRTKIEDNEEIIEYEVTQTLRDNCDKFKKYMMGNIDEDIG